MNDNKLRSAAYRLVILVLGGAVLRFAVKYLLGAAVPILLALAVSAAVRPLVLRFAKRTGMNVKVCGAVFVALSMFLVFYLTASLGAKLLGDAGKLLMGVVKGLEKEDNPLRRTVDFFSKLRENLPALDRLDAAFGSETSERIYGAASDFLLKEASKYGALMTSAAGDLIIAIPGIAFGAAVLVIGSFYLTMDRGGVVRGLASVLPAGAGSALRRVRNAVAGGLGKYARAYLIIMLVTFCELFAGFLILRVKYAFLIAAVVAAVDILPVLGSGTVLFPWAAVLALTGDVRRAVGLMVLLGVMWVVRQFMEPRLVGKFMGVHPFLSLCAAYVGFSLAGVAGLFAAPFILYALKFVFSGEAGQGEGKEKKVPEKTDGTGEGPVR